LRRLVAEVIHLGCAWDARWMRVEAIHSGPIRSRNDMAVDIDRDLYGAMPELLLPSLPVTRAGSGS